MDGILLSFLILGILCIGCLCDKDIRRSSFANGFIGFILMCDVLAISIRLITLILK